MRSKHCVIFRPGTSNASRNARIVVGQQVRVTSGVLKDLVGTVLAIDNPSRVLLSLANSPLKIAIGLGFIEPAP